MKVLTQLNIIILFFFLLSACRDTDDPIVPEDQLYFPPITSSEWETEDPLNCGWDTDKIDELYAYLQQKNTRAFIVLKNGKIVLEEYWGNNIQNTGAFNENSVWYWASAGKTLTAFLTGMAQEDGALNIEHPTSSYLGQGWTVAPLTKENMITVRHQLTMTTGLDYDVPIIDCTIDTCLQYRADAGTQWFYHNAPYILLESVISNATNTDYNLYTNVKVANEIGMNGSWINLDYNNVYWSNPRSAARFGLLMLAQGDWDGNQIMNDKSYFNDMITTSQNINESYGYLWWLNGKSSIVYPGLSAPIATTLAPNAPPDLYAAMGKNGQMIEIVPSLDLVVVRMGETPDNDLVPIVFHNEMWSFMKDIIGY